MQVAYSFKDEVALVEVAHKHNADLPAVRVFVKAGAGSAGLGTPSAGALRSPAIVVHCRGSLFVCRICGTV